MKGIILAGGKGTRLAPFTKLIKKELLPVYNKPLIYYPLDTLKRSGITDIVLISDPRNLQAFLDVLGEGEEMGLRIQYAVQNKQLGIANALYQAKPFIGKDESIAVILGDNIFTEDFKSTVSGFNAPGAVIAMTQVDDPERFGVVHFEGDKVTKIIEKPKDPESDWIIPGLYFYDNTIFQKIEKLSPSARGEYEITDVNNQYVEEGTMRCVKMNGKWFDAGTFDSLLEASNFFSLSNGNVEERSSFKKMSPPEKKYPNSGEIRSFIEEMIEETITYMFQNYFDVINSDLFGEYGIVEKFAFCLGERKGDLKDISTKLGMGDINVSHASGSRDIVIHGKGDNENVLFLRVRKNASREEKDADLEELKVIAGKRNFLFALSVNFLSEVGDSGYEIPEGICRI